MIIDGRRVPRDSTIEVDLCVVGAGPAGLSVALPFLGQSATKIALLETGGLAFDEAHQEFAEADVVGQTYLPVKETRIRMFGGSTISWGGIVSPLDPLDFEPRSWVPNSGWPFGRDELDPYYRQAFRLLDADPVPSSSTVVEVEGKSTPKVHWSPVSFSPPTRYGKKYRPRIAQADHLNAYLYSTATHVQLSEAGGRVEGLLVRCLGGNQYRVVARHYVLAGGGIENARLLMTSNDVWAGGVGNQHGLVGLYFQEHPRAVERYRVPRKLSALAQQVLGAEGIHRFSRLGLTPEVQRKEGLLNYIANLSFGFAGQQTPQFQALRRIANSRRAPWSDSPYSQHAGGGRNRLRWADVATAMRRPDRSLLGTLGATLQPASMRRWIEIETCIEQAPRPENRLVLTNETDPLGIPKVEIHWALSEAEERTYRRGLGHVLGALRQYVPGIAEHRADDEDPWPDRVLGTWHHIGTTRMDTDPKRGVVDAEGRVHGIANLYITGSSVFPTGGASPPTLTIVALALRLADHLADLGA